VLPLAFQLALLATRTAIAPVPTGKHVAPAIQRAFQDELPRALTEAGGAGTTLIAPNEVDMKVAEKPELLKCTQGPCLTDEAALLSVERLVVPQLEPLHDPGVSGVSMRLQIFDVAAGRMVADEETRCAPCSAESIRSHVKELTARLYTSLDKALNPQPVVQAFTATVVEKRKPRFKVIKWIALGAGLAAAGVGAGLWAIDGQGTCSLAPGQQQCMNVYDTLPAGAAMVGTGGALVLTSIVMIALDARN
jgi:hypothetical protein